MMRHFNIPAAFIVLTLNKCVYAQELEQSITGTWSTKSNRTLTGPGFYDPHQDRLIEPARTGVSYSFTDDGFYESAYYRAIDNPTTPQCTQGLMQWQHGAYEKLQNGSIVLSPIEVDGRQIISDPCTYDNSVYTRYNQSETFERAEVYTDPYHNALCLNLYKFDGSPLPPMYLAFRPPQMLPTTTLHPIMSSTASSKSTAISPTSSIVKERQAGSPTSRNGKRGDTKLGRRADAPEDATGSSLTQFSEASRWFWVGVACTTFGSALILCSRA